HEAEGRRRSVGRARVGDRGHVRRSRPAEGGAQRRGREAVRLRLDVARLGRLRPGGHVDAEPGQPADGGEDAAARHRRLGARLLPQVPEPPPRLPRRLVGRRQLGRGRPPLRRRPHVANRRRSGAVVHPMAIGAASLRLPAVVSEGGLAGRQPVVRAPAPDASDGELIQRTGAGDRSALEQLYRRYARSVYGLALRRLGDRGRAEDAVQETFLSIWRSAKTYRPERGPGAPWLYAVARNAIVDRHGRAAGRGAGRAGAGGRAARAGRAGVDAVARPPRLRRAAGERARGDRARLLARPLAERG